LKRNIEMRNFFNRLAPSWENNENEYEIRERLIDMIGIKSDDMIADIGCGRGVMFEHLLKTKPRRIFAVDISTKMLRYASNLFPNQQIMYLRGDILSAWLPTIDVALMYNAYPHFLDRKALAKKLAGHVRAGGCIVIAHSCSKERINDIHKEGDVARISVPLRPAEIEANEFKPYFTPEKMIDNNELYFLKMIRTK